MKGLMCSSSPKCLCATPLTYCVKIGYGDNRLRHFGDGSYSSLDDSVVDSMPLFDKMLLSVVDTVDTGTLDSSRQKSVQC